MRNLGLLKKFWILGAVFLVILAFEIVTIANVDTESDSLVEHDIPVMFKSQQVKLAVVQDNSGSPTSAPPAGWMVWMTVLMKLKKARNSFAG